MAHNKPGPIIIIGMHRSGTTMIVKLLEQAGLFVGAAKNQNHEANFFLRANRWLLRLSGGDWDYPAPFDDALQHAVFRRRFTEKLNRLLCSPRLIGYLGIGKYLAYRSLRRVDFAWGWKDPRNTFTLPLWLELFPDAKIVHISRHGVDVAASLYAREHRLIFEKTGLPRSVRREILPAEPQRWGADSSPRCYTLAGAFGLWEEYMDMGRRHCREYPTRIFSIQYETFVRDPGPCAERLLTFLELDCTGKTAANLTAQIRADRVFAYRNDPDLLDFSKTVRARLGRYGY